MPFKSVKQRRYMFSQHPDIAKRWVKKYGSKIGSAKRKRTKRSK